MNDQFDRSAGISLLCGTFLMVITMILHPVGGSIVHLQEIFGIAIFSHAIAILSIPFSMVGYWGLARKLKTGQFFSTTGFAVILLALIGAMGAAAVNGLAMPFFVKKYGQTSPEELEFVKMILDYSFSLNHAFDYIFIVGTCLAISLWSIAMIITKEFPLWLAGVGLLFPIVIVAAFLHGHDMVHLHEFRYFVLGMVAWTVCCAIILIKKGSSTNTSD